MIQVHYIYCALYFSTLDHQALDPRGWGPLQERENLMYTEEMG